MGGDGNEDGDRPGGDAGTATAAGTGTATSTPEPEIETTEGPAEFAVYDAAWAEGESLTVDAGSPVELTVGNRGGEPGRLGGELSAESRVSTVAEPLVGELSLPDEEVPSGQTVTVTSETVTPLFAGGYDATVRTDDGTLPVADEDAAVLAVAPHTGSTGETLPLGGDLRMRVSGVAFEDALYHPETISRGFNSAERYGLYTTLSDQTFAVVEATVENTGNSAARFEGDAVDFAGAAALSPDAEVTTLDGEPLAGANVNPGSRRTGWLLFRVARDAVPDAAVNHYRDSPTAAADAVWDLGLSDVRFPSFELTDVDVPDTFVDGNGEQPLAFTVANTGEATGTFRGAIEWRLPDDDSWDGLLAGNDELVARIPPGESATIRTTTTADGEESFEYRFQPFGVTFLVEAP